MIQAYQAGVSALKLSLKDVTVERAENLVDQIQEVPPSLVTRICVDGYLTFRDLFQLCDAQDDVNRTLSGGAAGAGMCVTVGRDAAPCLCGGLIELLDICRRRYGRAGGRAEALAG